MEQEMLQRLVTNAVREMRLPSRPEGRGSHVLTLVDAVLDAALDDGHPSRADGGRTAHPRPR